MRTKPRGIVIGDYRRRFRAAGWPVPVFGAEFTERGGTTLADLAGRAVVAVTGGAVADWIETPYGAGFQGASGKYATFGADEAGRIGAGDFTIAALVKTPTSVPNTLVYLCGNRGTADGDRGIEVLLYGPAGGDLRIQGDSGAAVGNATTVATYFDGAFHVFHCGRRAGVYFIAVDGVQAALDTVANDSGNVSTSVAFNVGHSSYPGYAADRAFNGQVVFLRAYDLALTDDAIAREARDPWAPWRHADWDVGGDEIAGGAPAAAEQISALGLTATPISVRTIVGKTQSIEASAQASATITATLTGKAGLVVAMVASGEITATLGGKAALGTAASAVASVTATLVGDGALESEISASALLTADLSGIGALAASIEGAATLTAGLSGAGALLATFTGSGVLTGTMAGAGAMAASVQAAGTLSATLAATGDLAASLESSATLTATIRGVSHIEAAFSGVATFTASLQGVGGLVATISATASVSAQLTGVGRVAASFQPVASLTATLTGTASASASFQAVATLVPTARALLRGQASFLASGTFSGTLQGKAGLQASLVSVGTVTATMRGDGSLSVLAVGTSTLAAGLTGAGSLVADFSASALLTAKIRDANAKIRFRFDSRRFRPTQVVQPGALPTKVKAPRLPELY